MQTHRDPILSGVLELVQSGWEGAEVKLFITLTEGPKLPRIMEFLWGGSKVVFSTKLREKVIVSC